MSILYKGIQVPVFSIPPNWKKPVRLQEVDATLVREALSTAEDRLQRRPRALFNIDYQTLTLSAQETGFIRKVLETAAEMPCAVGFWPDALKLTASATIGNPFVLTEATLGTLFEADSYFMLWSRFNNIETGRIQSVGTAGLNLVQPLTKAWIPGDVILPVYLGKLIKPNTPHVTDENGVFKVKFEEQFIPDVNRLCLEIIGVDAYFFLAMEQQCTGGPVP